ncbi:Hypothetical predicted protein [Marmota monax]|uniref:Ig-like domain-containing protein n=1 Tax=Marmota monax TaxID=9995 RepID=A0A5E4CQ87_MARMO|nr:paired immunoglobulin type 2 receptor alpha-like [Marmota monax]VTJ84003.1 Hypothetical predicted protein [Marmota monax]
MGFILLLLLLLQLPIASLKAGYSAACSKGYHYEVTQPEHLKAPKGGSITISFSFCYSWVLAKNPDVRISWRRKEFHGPFFYNHTSSFTHEDYKNRLSLDWKKGQKFGSLIIQNLREKDESTYFCRIQLNTEEGIKQWQSIKGTTVTITHSEPTPAEASVSLEFSSPNRTPHLLALPQDPFPAPWPLPIPLPTLPLSFPVIIPKPELLLRTLPL